jgi:cellulose biosynthesis protein BcsQ
MIPSDIRLFTWLDAEDVISNAREKTPLPEWFVAAQAYWDGLTITVRDGCSQAAKAWMSELFEPRIAERDGNLSIALESVQDTKRSLPVRIDEDTSQARPALVTLSFKRPLIISNGPSVSHPETTDDNIPVIAFHSFKGGVGRTTHAVATALRIAESRRVMLIDADFEAPGISWLLRERLPTPSISFADILAIMHGDPSQNADETLALASDRLLSSSFDNGVFVPAFRAANTLRPLDIRPEHIALGKNDPFFLKNFLSDLAKRLGVELVIVDLRAGFSELSASFLLDPRVYRVFVTNLSGQSMYGTQLLMEYVAQRAPSTSEFDPYPAIAITQVPEDYGAERLAGSLAPLQEAWEKFVLPKDLSSQADEQVILRSGFDRALQALPADWTALTEALRKSEAFAQASALLDWLPFTPQLVPQPPVPNRIGDLRKKLSEDAGNRIFAERSEDDDFLGTPALRALAQDNLRSVPISVLVGAKGAGKTLTFVRLAKLGTWEAFTRKVLGAETAAGETFINPVLLPISLDQNVILQIRERKGTLIGSIGRVQPLEYTEIREYLIECKQSLSTETEWRDAWLNAIAWSSGLAAKSDDGKSAISRFNPSGKRLVAIFDGLEDLFQEVSTDRKQQIALRALVQEVPLWLSQIPNRAIGLIAFIRRDLIEFAIHQNVAQLLDRYKPYALNWNRAEALRLTYWLVSKAKVMANPPDRFERLSEEELAEVLTPLWGRKLGSDKSRDARTAVWVLDALADYNGQVQARDLVRFVHFAAEKSGPDPKWPDRILTPTAIRDALPACSREKVRETRDENLVLREIFNKIDKIPAADRKAPFGPGFGGLTAADLVTLQQNGAILLDRDLYWVAEIYLHGLGFSYSAPGRRRVMASRR